MAYKKSPGLLKPDTLSEKLEQIDFDLLNLGNWQQEEQPVLRNDILSNYKLVCITAGNCTVSIGNEQYHMTAGDSILIAPFVLYTALCTGNVPVEFYDFRFNIKNTEALGLFKELFRIQKAALYPSSVSPANIPMLDFVFEQTLLGKQGCYYSTKLAFLRVMFNMIAASPDYIRRETLPHHTMGKEKTVEQCVRYLKNHTSTQVTVDDLCKAAHVSQSYLYQSFLSVTGQSTKEFIITYRLKLVELELKHSSSSIQGIAENFGFSSVYALSSQFKRFYGMSPLQYRKRYLAGV